MENLEKEVKGQNSVLEENSICNLQEDVKSDSCSIAEQSSSSDDTSSSSEEYSSNFISDQEEDEDQNDDHIEHPQPKIDAQQTPQNQIDLTYVPNQNSQSKKRNTMWDYFMQKQG